MNKQLGKIIKKCIIDDEISEQRLKMPQDAEQKKEINEIFKQNIAKFKKFTKTVINPISIAQLVDDMEAVNIKAVNLPESSAEKDK